MAPAPPQAPSSGHALRAALLAFHRHPGQYAVARQEPPVLFAAIPQILQLAAGKWRHDGPHGEALREAAVTFVRAAMLRPGADHYALLGLPRSSDRAAIKERYRLLMRLVHPDFAASGASDSPPWPADAATRLNQAYEVLSTWDKRKRYDEETARPPTDVARPPRHASLRPPKPAEQASDPRVILKILAGGFGITSALAVAVLLLVGGAELESLVQRPQLPADAVVTAQGDDVASQEMAPVTLAQAPLTPQLEPPLAATVAPSSTPPASTVDAPRVEQAANPAPVAAPPPAPAVAAAPAVTVAAVTPPRVTPATAPAQAPAPSTPAKSLPTVTMAEAHPLLSQLLQQMETGGSDRILSLLDNDARRAPAAQALMRHYSSLVDGGRPVKVARVQFSSEAREGRLLVTGNVLMQVGEPPAAAQGKELSVQAEFAMRDGTVVMTRLARSQE